jgi:4-hydroxy-tetrahydrodipicolinate synthase
MGELRRTPGEIKPLLCGVVNVQATPFKSMNEIDVEALRDNTRFLIEHGIVAGRGVLAIGGSTGEGFSLSDAEYRQLIDVVVEEADGQVPVCVGCVRPATQPVIDLAQYAERAGADCAMVLAPHYYPNEPEKVVYAHFRAVAEATDIPIMIYNNPAATGQDLSVDLLRRLAEIEQIVAVKECTSRTDKLREVAFYLADRLALLPCTTPRTMPFDYQLGAVGYVTWYANFSPSYALEIHDLCLAHDLARAREIYARSRPLGAYLEAAVRAGGLDREIALVKEMCRLVGRPMGNVERLPIVRPGEEERRELRRLMVEAGLLQGASGG